MLNSCFHSTATLHFDKLVLPTGLQTIDKRKKKAGAQLLFETKLFVIFIVFGIVTHFVRWNNIDIHINTIS